MRASTAQSFDLRVLEIRCREYSSLRLLKGDCQKFQTIAATLAHSLSRVQSETDKDIEGTLMSLSSEICEARAVLAFDQVDLKTYRTRNARYVRYSSIAVLISNLRAESHSTGAGKLPSHAWQRLVATFEYSNTPTDKQQSYIEHRVVQACSSKRSSSPTFSVAPHRGPPCNGSRLPRSPSSAA